MTTPIMTAVTERLPLRIRSVEWTDPTLLVSGDDWRLRLSCSWRIVSPKGIVLGYSSPDAEDRVWDLVGAEIVGVAPQGAETFADPALSLTGDLRLEAFSDTEIDPWVFTVGDVTIVGPVTRDDWP